MQDLQSLTSKHLMELINGSPEIKDSLSRALEAKISTMTGQLKELEKMQTALGKPKKASMKGNFASPNKMTNRTAISSVFQNNGNQKLNFSELMAELAKIDHHMNTNSLAQSLSMLKKTKFLVASGKKGKYRYCLATTAS